MRVLAVLSSVCLLSVMLVSIPGCSRKSVEPVQAAPTATQTPAPASTPAPQSGEQIEEAAPTVKFLDAAATLQELAATASATLVTPRSPGSGPIFIWIADAPLAQDPGSFTLNRAYHVRQEGKSFWGFIDTAASAPAPNSLNEFIQQRHVKQVVAFPTPHGDGNRSSVELIDRAGDGAAVYKIVYASASGARPHQEIVAIFLLYRSPRGVWALASNDLGDVLAEGSSRSGWEAVSATQQMRVEWTPAGEAPFRIQLESLTAHMAGFSGNFEPGGPHIPDYATVREGRLGGPLPLQLQMSRPTLFVSQRAYTLRDAARILTPYRGSSGDSEDARRRAEATILETLQRLNPGVGPGEQLTRDRRIVVPDDWR